MPRGLPRGSLPLVLASFLYVPTVLPCFLPQRIYSARYPGDIDRSRSQVRKKSPIHSFQLKSR